MTWVLVRQGYAYEMDRDKALSKTAVGKTTGGDPVIKTPLGINVVLNDKAPEPALKNPAKVAVSPEVVNSATKLYTTQASVIDISQPDALTCQSACIAMATGDKDVAGIRAELDRYGTAGDPAVMGIILRERLGDCYKYNGKASLEEIKQYLRDGEFLIIHTFLTPSGHVISLDGLKDVPGPEDEIDVKDPWSKFNPKTFSYDGKEHFFDGFYSARLIYASAVRAFTFEQAVDAYRNGEFDETVNAAWVHRILPKK